MGGFRCPVVAGVETFFGALPADLIAEGPGGFHRRQSLSEPITTARVDPILPSDRAWIEVRDSFRLVWRGSIQSGASAVVGAARYAFLPTT